MAYTWDKAPSSRQGTSTIFTTSGTSQPTAAFGSQTYQIRVSTGAQSAFIKIGDGTPTAASTGDSAEVPANTIDYFSVSPGQKLACVQGSGAGLLSVTEMS
jgi:hypothetical protein